MATHYGDGEGDALTMEDLKQIVADGEAYAAKRAEVLPKAIERIGGEVGWKNDLLEELGRERTANVVGIFLRFALCGIERQKLSTAIPPSRQGRDFLTLCREAGCDHVALQRLTQGAALLPQVYFRPSRRRCCLLRRKARAPLLAFSQYELYAHARGLRFARAEEMLELAIADPSLRFERCYAIGGAVDDGARGGGRVYVLSDHGPEENRARHVYQEHLPMTWTGDQQILAIKID